MRRKPSWELEPPTSASLDRWEVSCRKVLDATASPGVALLCERTLRLIGEVWRAWEREGQLRVRIRELEKQLRKEGR